MKKKIMGILISLLLIATAIPIVEALITSSRDAPVPSTYLSSIHQKESAVVVTEQTLNSPPVFMVPYPLNNSLDNPLNLIFSIVINDPEGDTISWTLQCSNGQTNSGTNQNNGTKLLVLDDLYYITKYKVWVNATDPLGSGLYTRAWFNFTTKISHRPVFGSPTPINRSTDRPLNFKWNISISDPDGDKFSWSIECSNGQVNSSTNAVNGTKSLTLSGLAYGTTFDVWVNATDPAPNGSGLYNRKWYIFTTILNKRPVFGSPTISNGSSNQPLSINWSILINDSEGDLFNWTIQCKNGQTSIGSSASNGTKSLVLSGLANLTTYKVWVNATDPTGSNLFTRRWYVFTTEGDEPPIFGLPSPSNSSSNASLSFSWSIPISDPDGSTFSWTIQCSNGQFNNGTNAVNGTKSLALSGLTHVSMYKIWVNATDPTGSGLYTRKWFIFSTRGSQQPGEPMIFGPTNGKTKTSYSYNFVATDPDGDDIFYRIDWGDGSAVTQWIGPFSSGDLLILPHTFSSVGICIVKCQAKDTNDAMSDWGTLEVTMPYSYNPFIQFLELVFQRFPNAFPFLRHLLGY